MRETIRTESFERLAVSRDGIATEIAVRHLPGEAPGVLWLGGFNSDMTGTKAEALAGWGRAKGRAVTRFDYCGHGESGGRFEDGTISVWLADVRDVFERFCDRPTTLVGSSMGGWIALLLARQLRVEAPEAARRIAGLVLIAPAVDFTERLMWDRFPPDVRETILTEGVWRMPSEYGEPCPITRALIEDGRRHLMLDEGPIETGCPVHVLQGVRDPDVPWRHAVEVVTHLARDDVVLTLVKDGDHRLSREADIARLIAAVEGVAEA